MSKEADITRMHAEWVERKSQIQLDYETKIRNAEANFNTNLGVLDSDLRGELEESRQTLTQERDSIFSQLDMVFQRRLKEKEAILEEKRNLHLDRFRKDLDGQRKELAEALDKTLQEHEMDYFKIMRGGGPSLSRPPSTAPSAAQSQLAPSAPSGAPPPQHRPLHQSQPSVPGRPPLQPAPAPVLAQPRQPPLQPNPQSRQGPHPSFAMPPQHRMSQPTQLQAPRPFQPPQQPVPSMGRPGPGPGLGRPQAHQTGHQNGPAPPPERRPLARVPTLPSQHPPTAPTPSVSKPAHIAPAKQHPPETRQEQQRPAERLVERPIERPAEHATERRPEQPQKKEVPEQPRQEPELLVKDDDAVIVDSPKPMSAPPVPAPRRSTSTSASIAAASQTPIATAPPKDDEPAYPERRHSRRQSSARDISPAPAIDSRPSSRSGDGAMSLGRKRPGSSLSTPQPSKMARNSTPPLALASHEKLHRTRRAPSTHPQWISFDEVYQNGKATFKHMMTDWPPGSGIYFIMKCNEHGVHFNNTNPVSGAAKHLNGKDHHHMTKDRKQAVELLGYHVYDCTPELAAKNNEVVNHAFRDGYKIFTQKDRRFRETYNPDGTLRNDAQKAELAGSRRGPRGSIGPVKGGRPSLPEMAPPESPKMVEAKATPVKEVKGVIDAVPGEIYYGYWTKNKMKYAVVVCGRKDQKCIGLPGKTLGQLWPTLLNRAPSCYKVNKQVREIEGWADGYEDGGPLVHRRAYAVQFFDKSRGVAWLQARHLSPFLMDDPTRPRDPDHPFNQAREFYARLRGFASFDEWNKSGAKHGPVTTEESSSEYNTPGELPPEDNPDHGEPDEEMDFTSNAARKDVEDQDEDYDPDQTEEEDAEMEDAPDASDTPPAAPRPRSGDREHRRGHSNGSSKTVDAAESKSEEGSASARKGRTRTPESATKTATPSVPVDTGSTLNQQQLFGRALEYMKRKEQEKEEEKQKETV